MQLNRHFTLEKEIKTWLFFKNGSAKLDVTFDKDAYNPDETLHAVCKIDNSQCEKDINSVKITLRREIVCYASDGAKFT